MKREDFIVAMAIEVVAALISMGLLFSDVGALIYPISLALFAVVQTPFYLYLRKTSDEAKKRKIRVWMALLMLIPIVAALVAIALVVIALMLLYA